MSEPVWPSDKELLEGKGPSEDGFVERKTSANPRDWVRTVVAFANSAPYERVAVLYIGVREDGSVEEAVNLDSVQKTLRQKLSAVYPLIQHSTKVIVENGKQFLCVLVPGSRQRPHFSAPAYVRIGSETVNASPEQFEKLIAQRNNKVYKILKHQGERVLVEILATREEIPKLGRVKSAPAWEIVDCTQFTATFRDSYGETHPIALERIRILEDAAWPKNLRLEVSAE